MNVCFSYADDNSNCTAFYTNFQAFSAAKRARFIIEFAVGLPPPRARCMTSGLRALRWLGRSVRSSRRPQSA